MTIKTFAIVDSTSGITISKEKVVTLSTENKSYKFDGAYVAQSEMNHIFTSHINKSVQSVLTGFNSSIVGFIQHMPENNFNGDSGLVSLAMRAIFKKIEENSGQLEYLVSASMLQVTRDGQRTDLISPRGRKLMLKSHSQQGLYIDGLSHLICPTAEDATRLFEDGYQVSNSLKLAPYATVYTVKVCQRSAGTRPGGGTTGCLQFLVFYADKQNLACVSRVLSSLAQKKSAVGFTEEKPLVDNLLTDALMGNTNSFFLACVSNKDLQGSSSILSAVEPLSGIGSSPKANRFDNDLTSQQLRQEIANVRNRLSNQTPANKGDLSLMERLINDLDETKRTGWDQMILRSEQFYEERKTAMSNKGLSWILESTKPANREKLMELQKARDKLAEEYKQQRQVISKISTELKVQIDIYTKAVNSGKKDEKQEKERVAKIQELKEQLRKENDKLKEIEVKQRNADDNLMKERQSGMNENTSSFDVSFQAMAEERRKLKEEDQQLVEDKLERMKIEVEHARADLEMKSSSGNLASSNQEVLANAIELATLRSEKTVITTQLDTLKRELTQMDEHMRVLAEKHSRELEIQQLQNLQTFRAYREVFEEFKVELENRWRGLLDDAIQDAVFLNARNTELMERNAGLKLEVAQLKDDRSIKQGGRQTNKA